MHQKINRKISIHSLLAEGDCNALDLRAAADISIHSLLAEGDEDLYAMYNQMAQFQSTPSSRRETAAPQHRYLFLTFQSTPSSRRETAKPANHFHHPLAKFCKLIFSFSFRAPFSPLFPSKRLLFPVRTSPAFPVRFLFAPARHTISTSSG